MEKAGTIVFADYELDIDRSELRRGGVAVAIEPRTFDLISHMARNAGTVISRDGLIEAVWGGRIVSDSAISSCVAAARTALGDDGETQRFIRTIPRRGFRFEAEVAMRNRTDAAARTAQTDKPSIAVLPFQNMSGDPTEDYFSDGITVDIITDLSRYDELFVIAPHSSFAYRHSAMPAATIARELGAQYILEGSIRRAGNRMRVTASLFDPKSGNTVWAERYDRDVVDIFDLQDKITAVIVNTLVGQITRQHFRTSMAKSDDMVQAYEHILRSMELVVKFDFHDISRARDEAEAALALDPKAARAHAAIAWAHLHLAINAFTDDPDQEFALSRKSALAAVAADDREPYAHATLGWAYQFCSRATDQAFASMDRAVSLNPGNAHYRCLRAFSMTYAGRCEEALSVLEEGMRLNPHFPVVYHVFCGRALFHMHCYSEAVLHLERVRIAQPTHPNALALVAAAYQANGQKDEARAAAGEVHLANPRFTVSHSRRVLPYVIEEEREFYLEMLAATGLQA